MSELAEKDAIREVMAEYCFRLDNDRFADMAALFTEDGTWDTAFGKGTGRAEVEALVRACAAPAAAAARDPSRDQCRDQGRGATAKCFSNWVTVQNSEQGPKIGSAGSYTDDMVKQDGSGCSAIARSTGSSTTRRDRLTGQSGPTHSAASAAVLRRQIEPAIPVRRDVVAGLAVRADAADIRHEHLRLAGNVDAHVPGVRQRVQRLVGDLVAVLRPMRPRPTASPRCSPGRARADTPRSRRSSRRAARSTPSCC